MVGRTSCSGTGREKGGGGQKGEGGGQGRREGGSGDGGETAGGSKWRGVGRSGVRAGGGFEEGFRVLRVKVSVFVGEWGERGVHGFWVQFWVLAGQKRPEMFNNGVDSDTFSKN